MQPHNSLLIVEDDPGLARQLRWHFEGLSVHVATTVDQAIECVTKHRPKVVLQDLGFHRMRKALTRISMHTEHFGYRSQLHHSCMTGKSEEANALRAIGLGAQDFFHKPIDPNQLDFVVKRAFETARLRDINRHQGVRQRTLKAKSHHRSNLTAHLSATKISQHRDHLHLDRRKWRRKEVFANTIHRHSQRHNQHFQAINCAAIPENLIESELFGYEKGAFTGAAKTTAGKIESANHGTLFLDEIGDMPLLLQTKLLRFLQQRTIQRVGSTQDIPVDVRVV